MENLVRSLLQKRIETALADSNIVQAVISNELLLQQWTSLSACVADEESAIYLLKEMVRLWTAIRGFALASSLIEKYKRSRNKGTKTTTILRKSLCTSN